MLEDLKFANVVISKVVLPKESARNHVNGHARYALYKIFKKVKVNPSYLIWDLIRFLEKIQGNLPFGSLITVLIGKKELVNPYLNPTNRLEKDVVLPIPIKLFDV